jgi:hypothetical protein
LLVRLLDSVEVLCAILIDHAWLKILARPGASFVVPLSFSLLRFGLKLLGLVVSLWLSLTLLDDLARDVAPIHNRLDRVGALPV